MKQKHQGKLTKVKLVNFQSHTSTTLDLCPGVNVLVGSSDSGKSAVVRALGLVVFNRPSGDAWCRRHGAEDDTSVTVSTDAEVAVRRVRGKHNEYQIKVKGGEPKSLKAVGTDVPQPIVEALNLGELNMQRQGDRHFLLSESPSETARILNEVAGLEEIDKAHSVITAIIRENNRELAAETRRLADCREELKCFEGMNELSGRADALSHWETTANNQAVAIRVAKRAVAQIKDGEAWMVPLEKQLTAIQTRFTTLTTKKTSLDALETRLGRAVARLTALNRGKADAEVWNARLGRLRDELSEAEAKAKVCPTCGRAL